MADPGTEAFEELVALLNYPMFVVTTQANDTAAGCLVGFASQTSIHPPRFLVGISRRRFIALFSPVLGRLPRPMPGRWGLL